MAFSVRLRYVAVVWLLSLVTFLVVRTEHLSDAQTVIGLILGTITTLVVAHIGVVLTRDGNTDD